MTETQINGAFTKCIGQIRANLAEYTEKFPAAASVGNYYPKTENDDWTNGFWTGQLWLAYEKTGEVCFKEAALWQVRDFKRRMIERVAVDHHDMGFLYSPSCVAAYRLLKDSEDEWDRAGAETAREAALMAADNLLGRFQENGRFFQAWGKVGDPNEYRLIIDCFLNMPLLFWASEVTGEEHYREKAQSHIRTAMDCVVRPDFSTFHTFYFDPETGKPLRGVTQQGNRDGSIWARGQAWGIYGAALSFGYFHDVQYQYLFDQMVECFFAHLPADQVPYWDFDFTDGSEEPRDSSSAAIAACGLLEMADHMEEERACSLRRMASSLMTKLTKHCLVKDTDSSNGILLHGTYAKHSAENGVRDSGVDECNLWGDYFYMEALARMSGSWKRYW